MTPNPSIESAAEAAYRKYRERYHADVGPSAWGELGDAQRKIWREVARAVLQTVKANSMEHLHGY